MYQRQKCVFLFIIKKQLGSVFGTSSILTIAKNELNASNSGSIIDSLDEKDYRKKLEISSISNAILA